MSTLLIKMAQAAIEDETLFAPYIQQYASQKSLSWDEVATNLQIGHEQLAKLALCSRPQSTSLSGGILQVANYVGIDHFKLKTFVAEVEGREAVPTRQVSRLNGTYKAKPSRRSWNIMGLIPKRLSWAIGVVAILVILMMGAFVSAQPESTSAATLVVREGQATITQTAVRNPSELVVSAEGDAQLVHAGDRILVMAGSTAIIHLDDGSEVELTAGTKIDVEELVIDGDTYRVGLKVLAGQALSKVITVLGVDDRFEVSTPSSTASVRGTIFTVAVLSATESYISCDEGKVEVTLDVGKQDKVTLTPGEEVTAVVNQPLNVKSILPPVESLTISAPPDVSNPTETQQEGSATETETTQPDPIIVPPASNNPGDTGPFENGRPGQVPGSIPGEGSGNGELPPSPSPTPIPPVDPSEPSGGGDGITICHHPSESSGNTVTITVSESALQTHLDHGDTEGECPPPPTDTGNSGSGNGGGSGGGGNNGNGNGGGTSNNGNGGGNGNGPKDKQIVY